jgi:predicted transcriptional regulator
LENSKKKQTKTVALDARLHRELKILAVQREMDLSDLLNRAVKEFLARSGGTTERPRQGS